MDDDLDDNIQVKIKKFLASDSDFRNPNFDPAPFLIKILKEKQGDQEAMIERQNQLIGQENNVQQLIQQILEEQSEEFQNILEVPQRYGKQLEKLKSNISVVKKKVKQTKSLLLMTQKDIQQLHFNCIFNKLVYKKLKELQLKLQQYQTASLALKNNQFLTCSMNLPFMEGHSILQSTLNSRAETLRLRLLSRAIQQLSLFVYFTPKAILPSTNVLLERTNQGNETILNWNQHQGFYKRYFLFKKAFCEEYLAQIWKFDDLKRKTGKIGFIYDVIKGVMNICKIDQVSESIDLNCKKSIANIFLLLQYFFVKEPQNQNQRPMWFFSTNPKPHREFISTVLCISGAVLRKMIIVRKMYKQFELSTLKFNSGFIFTSVLSELKQLLTLMYFPELCVQQTIEHLPKQIKSKLVHSGNYIYFGFMFGMIRKSLLVLMKNLTYIEESEFQRQCPELKDESLKFLDTMNEQFFKEFHKQLYKTLQQIFQRDQRPFTAESFDTIILSKFFPEEQSAFQQGYRTEDKKAIKQYMYVVSFLRELGNFFRLNSLNEHKFLKYNLFIVLFFYLKLNSHICRFVIREDSWAAIQDLRKQDKKVKNKETSFQRVYYKLYAEKKQTRQKILRKNTLMEKMEFSDFNVIDRLRVFKAQDQMFFSFSCHHYDYIQDFRSKQGVNDYERLIEKLQVGSYEENIQAKFIRIWDMLPQGQQSIKEATAAVFQKFVNLHLNICAKIYMESGVY